MVKSKKKVTLNKHKMNGTELGPKLLGPLAVQEFAPEKLKSVKVFPKKGNQKIIFQSYHGFQL